MVTAFEKVDASEAQWRYTKRRYLLASLRKIRPGKFKQVFPSSRHIENEFRVPPNIFSELRMF